MNSNGVFVVLPQARADLLEITRFLSLRNSANAVKFVRAARETFDDLAQSPFLGAPQGFSDPAHHSLRHWPVKSFRSYQIFYRPFASSDGVQIWRVLHNSQEVVPRLEEVSET